MRSAASENLWWWFAYGPFICFIYSQREQKISGYGLSELIQLQKAHLRAKYPL